MVLLCGLQISTGYTECGASYVLPRATRLESQSYLQMVSTCARLGGAQERPSCEAKPASTSAKPGVT